MKDNPPSKKINIKKIWAGTEGAKLKALSWKMLKAAVHSGFSLANDENSHGATPRK